MGRSVTSSIGINAHIINATKPPSTESGARRDLAERKKIEPKTAAGFTDLSASASVDLSASKGDDSDSSEGDVAALFAQMRQKVANNEISESDSEDDRAHTVKNAGKRKE